MNRTLLTAALLALTTTAHAASPGTTLQVGIDLTASPSPLYALVSGSWKPWGVFSSGNFFPVMGGCSSGYVHAAASTPGTNPVVCQAIAFSDVTGALATPLPIVNGGTGQTTASAAFNALSPLTTQGDTLYGGVAGIATRLPIGANGTCYVSNGSVPSWGSCGGIASFTFPITVSGTTSSGGIPYFSNATTLSSSAALAANALVIGGGSGVAPSTTTTGTGVITAVGNNTNAAGGIYTYGTLLPAAMFPALNGDLATSAGSLTTTLATVNANVGTWGSTTQAPSITVNGKGLITGVTLNTITPSIANITGLGAGVATALANNANAANGVPTLNGSGVLPIAQGGNGTASPGILAGTNITVTGSWPTQTVNATIVPLTFPATVVGGVSGGIPYFLNTTTMAVSPLLTANNLMIGGGVGAAPTTTTTGSNVLTAISNNLNAAAGLAGVNSSSAPTVGHCLQWSASGIQDAGGACTTGGGGGTVTAAPQYQIPYYSSAGTANTVTGSSVLNISSTGATLTIGTAGATAGALSLVNATSGSVTLQTLTGALGSSVLTLPTATDQLIGRATTDTLTNKTMSTGSVWNGTIVGATYGGTGVNNGSSTITLGASLTTTGAGAPTLAFPASTRTYTFPNASDTIAVLGQPQTFTATQTFPNGSLTLSEITSQSANIILGTTAAGSPTALTMPAGCASATTALNWTNGTGFGCNTTVLSGPGSSTANAIATWSNTSGNALLNTLDTISANGTLSINPTANSSNKGFLIGQSGPASIGGAGPFTYNEIDINHSTDASTATDKRTVGLYMQSNVGGVNQKGAYIGAFLNMNHNSASSSGADHIALNSQAYTSVSDTSGGQIYAAAASAVAASTATALGLVGAEIDTEVDAGATVTRRTGIRSVNQGASHAGTLDTAFSALSTNLSGSFNHLLTTSTEFTAAPLVTTGDWFFADAAQTVQHWANLTNLTVTGNILAFPNVVLTGAGALTLGKAGTAQGSLALAGSTSGTTTIAAQTSGGGTMTLQAGSDTLVGRATTDTLTNKTMSGASNTFSNIAVTALTDFHAQGRLTVSSGTPVVTSNVSGATTIYYVPYNGRAITIYNGTNDINYDIGVSGINIALGSNWAANSAFDVFVYNNSGSPALCTVAWTNTTTRATALDLATRGYYTNSGTPACRTGNASTITLSANQGTYLGSFYTNGSTGQVDYVLSGSGSGGAAVNLGLWNYYNRVLTAASVTDNGVSYTYNSTTIREARGSSNNQVNFMIGVVESGVNSINNISVTSGSGSGSVGNFGLGLNSTTLFTPIFTACQAVGSTAFGCSWSLAGYLTPSVGKNYIAALEQAGSTFTVTNFGGTVALGLMQ